MTDTAPPPTDGIEFVHSGIIRFHFAPDKVVRVRRPFLGELKTLRLALADVSEELTRHANEVRTEGQSLQDALRDLATQVDAGEVTPAARAARVAEIQGQDREAARELNDRSDDLTLGWWGQVFDLLAMDPVPEDWPAWLLDSTLPSTCLTHWRTVPVGPG